MTFYLQYRDGPSDTALIEFRSPLPLPVPRVGEHVELFDTDSIKKASGKVERVYWAYRPLVRSPVDTVVEGVPLRIEGEESEGLLVAARVWLTPDDEVT